MATFNNLRFEDDLTSCPIVFLHIPKTGGTSFIEVLNEVYGTVVRGDDNNDIGRKLTKQLQSSVPDVICGHFNMSAPFYKERLPNYAHVTVIRDPVERVLSQLYYLKNTPSHPFYNEIQNLSIADIYNSKENLAYKYEIADRQLTLVAGFVSLSSKRGTKLKRAIDNLQSRFSFFGLCEEMDDFINLCYKKFGWSSVPEIPRSNCSPADRNDYIVSSEKDLELIRENNKYEMQWYDWATKLHKNLYSVTLIAVSQDLTVKPRAIEPELAEPEIIVVKLNWWKRLKDRLKKALSWRTNANKDN
jgi:hypothetical protein